MRVDSSFHNLMINLQNHDYLKMIPSIEIVAKGGKRFYITNL